MKDYQQQLGARLRAIRQQQGLTLQEVEARSEGKWKAVVVGSYERGDRAVSVSKLADLGDFYGVPVSALLPADADGGAAHIESPPSVKLDLRALANTTLDAELAPVSRFAHTIQQQRGDYNGSVLTIRAEDLRALAVLFGLTPDELVQRLDDAGVLAAR